MTSQIDLAGAKNGTPEWWLNYLLNKFIAPAAPSWMDWRHRSDRSRTEKRCDRLNNLWSYFIGQPPLPRVAQEYQEIFQDEMRKARSNYAPMAINAMLDRMGLQGIATAEDSDVGGDDIAAEIADISNLIAELKDLFAFAFVMGESYVLLVPPTDSSAVRLPVIRALDPRSAVGEPSLSNPLIMQAFLTRVWDPIEQQWRVDLFLPGKQYTAVGDGVMTWSWIDDGYEQAVDGIDDLGGIPAVRLENPNGLGEFEPHLDLLDRINDTTLQRLVLTLYQAFRQRAVVGDLEGDDDDDQPEEEIDWNVILKADPGSVWRLPAGTTFWESSQADLTPIINAKRDDVKEFAAVTSTPLHLITPDAANGSAEGASLMREGLNHKVMDRRARFTPALKLMYRIAFAMAKQAERGSSIRLLWGSLESNSLAEKGSATAQARGVLSLEKILTDIWGLSPEDAQQNIQQLMADRLTFGIPIEPGTTSNQTGDAATPAAAATG